ncbi:MAG: hypothetical protein AAFY15_15360, partial [Cyanobacteria bacterium J06648_11]
MTDFNPIEPQANLSDIADAQAFNSRAAADCPIVPAPALSRDRSTAVPFPAAGALAFLGTQSDADSDRTPPTHPVY